MRKIPTLFVRNPDDRAHVLDQVTIGCEWVWTGEGRPTRKYDGTCVMLDENGEWWARREIKPGKAEPNLFFEEDRDETTGKRVGWEPIMQSPFARFHAEVLGRKYGTAKHDSDPDEGTYELIGPKINGNPESCEHHALVRHGYTAAVDRWEMDTLLLEGLTYDTIRDWLLAHPDWEGLVWHHPDGRMAKIKRKDFQ